MKFLVTGGAGFIGHHLVRHLLERSDEVRVLDDFSTGLRGRTATWGSGVDVRIGDIRDPDAVKAAMEGVEVVFHEAALPSVARSVADPLASTSVNVDGTVQVMVAAAAAGVRRVVFAGSSSVYGATADLPRRITQRPDPRSPYAATKLAGEHLVHTIGALRGVETVVLRYFNVFGPGQDPASQYAAVVPRWVTAALENEAPILYGDGRISRDFTYIENVVAANMLAAIAATAPGGTFNVACGAEYSLFDLLDAIGKALGKTLEPVVEPPRPGDVPRSLADISETAKSLGYRVLVPFEEGIRRTVESYRQASPGTARRA